MLYTWRRPGMYASRWLIILIVTDVSSSTSSAVSACDGISKQMEPSFRRIPRTLPLDRLDIPADLPVRDGLIPQSYLVFPCSAVVVDKLVPKHFPRNTILGHELGGRLF